KDRIIYQSCDTMTHSLHRRKGLFKLLANHCYSYLRNKNELFIIGFGGDESTPGLIKFGWQEIFKFQYIFRVNIQSYLSYFLNKIITLTSKTYSFKKTADYKGILNLRNGNE